MSALTLTQYHGSGIPVDEGVTTVWLLSTLGNTSRINIGTTNSTSSNIKKKDIINVSIPKTCTVIQNNDLNLPLRYVSSLLYGVTVCYHRKTEYVLNDITGLLTQLQKKIYSGNHLKKRRINDAEATTIIGKKKSNVFANAFLDDDPSFDINQANRFETAFNDGPKHPVSESVLIRRQDYMNELTNSINFDKPGTLAALNRPNRSVTLDDIPIDFDFNFELDEIVSRQGTAMGSSTDSVRSGNDLHVNYDDREFALNFDRESTETNDEQSIADNTGINLGIAEDIQEEDADQHEKDYVKPTPTKIRLMMRNNGNLPKKIIVDERIGLTTDILRSNHNNYLATMEANKKSSTKNEKFEGGLSILNDGNSFLPICWGLVFSNGLTNSNRSSFWPAQSTVERGRKRARSNASSRSSSEVASEEQGRRAVFQDEESFNDHGDLSLNLEQIDEEQDETDSGGSSSYNRSQDLFRINLDLPSSSFGRTQTRSNTHNDIDLSGSSRNYERDVVDELYKRTHRNNNTDIPENSSVTHFHDSGLQILLDFQTKKFYDYIKSRSIVVGKRTNASPLFSKKMLFEDIVPSKLSQSEDDDSVTVLERKIAANAFLSLLNLATKNLLAIKEYEQSESTALSPLLNGDDIVIYI